MRPFAFVLQAATRAALALGLAAPAAALAGEVLVAVAANVAPLLDRIAAPFTAATGHTVKASAGATGKFHAQIVAGAPFHVLMAADAATPARLVAEGHAVAGTAFTYAVGALALWSARPGLVDDQGAVLARPGSMRLAIANPKAAPYGAAAMQVLAARGLQAAWAPRLVTGESVGHAFQFVATGNAELGFVALSQLMQPGQAPRGSMWRVPASLHQPIRQDAVLLKAGQANPAARAFLDHLRSPGTRALLREHGYE